MIEVPASFASSTIAREGDRGRAWIAALPMRVRDLCEEWELALDGAPMHGYVALVLPVTRAGAPLVLKVSWIDQASEQEAIALRAWQGIGAVRLFEARMDVGAMLLERLHARRTLDQVAEENAVNVAAHLMRRLSISAPPELRPVPEEVECVRESLRPTWERTGRPFPERLLERALELSETPARRAVPLIVNQDLHYGNVLGADREPWLVIDPKPLAGDPEFGVPQLLWNRFEEMRGPMQLERRIARLVDIADLDAEYVRRWSVFRAIDYWLWAVSFGLSNDAERCRALVDWLEPEIGNRSQPIPRDMRKGSAQPRRDAS